MTATDPLSQINPDALSASPFASDFSPFKLSDVLPEYADQGTADPGMSLSGILGPSPTANQPFAPNAPTSTKAFYNKYQQLTPALSTLPPLVGDSLMQFDAKRVARGQSPLGPDQTANLIRTAVTGKPATPEPERRADIPALAGNAVSDLKDIFTSLPHLPANLLKDLKSLPNLPGQFGEVMQKGGGLGKELQGISQLPGVRLLPGAYTAGNLAAGDFTEMMRHPLFTGMDVLPFAKGLKPSLTSALEGTRAGEMFGAIGQRARDSAVGQFATQAFGKDSRALARVEAQGVVRMTEATTSNGIALPEGSIDAFTRSTYDFARKWQKQFTPERHAELVDIATTTSPKDWSGITDSERGFLNEYRDIAHTKMLEHLPDEQVINGEVYSPTQVRTMGRLDRRIAGHQAQLDRTHLFTRLNAMTGSGEFLNVAPETTREVMRQLWDEHLQPFLQSKVPAAEKREAMRGYAASYAAHGFELPADVGAVLRGKVADATEYFNDFAPTHTGTPPTPGSPEAKLVDQFTARNGKYTIARRDRAAEVIGNRIAKVEERKNMVLPARFEPMVEQTRQQAILAKLGDVAVDEDTAFARAANRQYGLLIQDGYITPDEFAAYTKDAKATVAKMRQEGFDPVFMHKVAPERASLVDRPRVLFRETTPSSLKDRTYDVTPYIKDFTVALPHQAMEMLQSETNSQLLGKIMSTDSETRMFAKTRQELDADYEQAAKARASLNPHLDVASWTDKMRNREWVRVRDLPKEFADRPELKGLLSDDVFLPKPVWRNMQRMMAPAPMVGSILDLPLKMFRTSVLALSPRFLLNQALGAMVELTAATDPLVFRYYKDARELITNPGTPLPSGAMMNESMRATMGSTMRAAEVLPPVADFHYRAGTTMGRLWNKIQDSKAAGVAQGVVKKSFDMAGFVDDTSRAMAYLYGYDKNLAKGMTRENAMAAGEAFARKSIQTLDELTPLERSVMRSVFPFYGFMRHILHYSYNYAVDHPFRASVVSALGRMEQTDWNTGLPQMFQGSFFLGSPNAKGDVKIATLTGLNPWRDMANMFTLGGFVSQVNPLVSGTLKAMGMNTQTGSAELYPQLDFDDRTGTIVAKHRPLLGSVLQSLVPQQTVIAGLLGASSPIRDLMGTNPEAAQRMFASSLGVPLVFRTINVPEYSYKTELGREQVQQDVLSKAISSGDYARAQRYPQLRPLLSQVSALNAQGLLGRYARAEVASPSNLEFAQSSLAAALAGQ